MSRHWTFPTLSPATKSKVEQSHGEQREGIQRRDYLMDGNARIRKRLGLPSDEEFSDDDVSIIEDDEEEYEIL
jgi:hypothetical protein